MSIFEYFLDVLNGNHSEFWRHTRFPIASAAFFQDTVFCPNNDGTTREVKVCTDENGDKIDCPVENTEMEEVFSEVRHDSEDHKVCRARVNEFTEDDVSEMAPPYYADLGKKANDVFSKGYHFGVFKLDLKTKSESGVEFSSGIVNNQESGKVFGSLQSKYAVKDYGLTFTEKWNTDNTLATDITIQDKIVAGLKLTLEGTFAPQSGNKTGKLKSSYTNDSLALNSNIDLDPAGPVVDAAAVIHYQGWLAGANTAFDSQKSKITKTNLALGYQTKDFSLHTNVNNGQEFGGSIYQKVSDKLECGISMKWSSGSADTLFGVGLKHALDNDTSLHAKVNNKALIGVGYQQKIRQGVTLTLSAAIDGQNFNAGGHKIGLALELEP